MAASAGRIDEWTDPGPAAAVTALGDAAIERVTDDLLRRQAETVSVRGAFGRLQTRQDLRHHLEFLAAALAVGMPGFFADYLRWAASVLDSRGGSVRTLDASLDLLRQFFQDRLDPQHRDAVAAAIDEGRHALATTRPTGVDIYGVRLSSGKGSSVASLVQALVDGDVARARGLSLGAWEAEGNYVRVATGLFQPALYELGLQWQYNRITVAQEHLATAICQTLLTQLYLTAALFVRPIGRSALFAAIEGSQHALGIRIVADAFELAGWTVQHLGADTPDDDLVAHVAATRPDLVGLSVSLVHQLPGLRRLIDRLRAELGGQCPTIMVGGLPINHIEGAGRWSGADAWSPDAETALKEVS